MAKKQTMSRKIEQKVTKETKGLREAAAEGDPVAQFMSRGLGAQGAVDEVFGKVTKDVRSPESGRSATGATNKCRVCGCTESAACETGRGPCFWVERDLCSGPLCGEKLVDRVALRRILEMPTPIAQGAFVDTNRATRMFALFDMQRSKTWPKAKASRLRWMEEDLAVFEEYVPPVRLRV